MQNYATPICHIEGVVMIWVAEQCWKVDLQELFYLVTKIANNAGASGRKFHFPRARLVELSIVGQVVAYFILLPWVLQSRFAIV